MKKIFKISLVSLLAVMPMVAGAEPATGESVTGEPVAGEPVAGNSNSPTAISAPKYALAPANSESDNTVATAGYVKGAYNAIIKGINKTQEGVDTLNADITTNKNTIDHLLDGKATQTGTVATINNASTTESIDSSSVWVRFANVTTTSISAKASGDVKLSVAMMSDWDNDSVSATPVETTTSFSDLPVDGLEMRAPQWSNTATLTESGIKGTVNVVKYLAKGFSFTKLIDVTGNSWASKSADGKYTKGNASGLSNGEWSVTWDNHGTIRGTTMCSTTGGRWAQTGTPANENGKRCWCKMTGWTPKGGTETPAASLWVFYTTSMSDDACLDYCAELCGKNISGDSYMREGLFSDVQQ